MVFLLLFMFCLFVCFSNQNSFKKCFSVGRPRADALAIESELAARVMMHPDAIEGPLAFVERREARWLPAKL